VKCVRAFRDCSICYPLFSTSCVIWESCLVQWISQSGESFECCHYQLPLSALFPFQYFMPREEWRNLDICSICDICNISQILFVMSFRDDKVKRKEYAWCASLWIRIWFVSSHGVDWLLCSAWQRDRLCRFRYVTLVSLFASTTYASSDDRVATAMSIQFGIICLFRGIRTTITIDEWYVTSVNERSLYTIRKG